MTYTGWASRALAQQECAKVPGDNCCTKLLNGKPSGTTEQPGTSTSSSTAAASNGAPSNTSGLSPGITTLIIVVVLVMVLGAGLFLYFRMRSSKPQNTGGNRIPAFKASPMSRDSFFEPKPKGLKQNSFFSPMMESAKSPAQSPGNNGYLRTVTVTHPYDATLQDELALNIGDQVHIVKEFDDGWALGVHAVTQQEGAFPLVCTEDRSDSGSETNDNRLTLPPFSASDDPEAGWKKGAESIRISKRMSSQIWDKESRLSSDGRSSVNPFRGRATTSMNSFGSPLKQNFSRDMRDTPKDDYYDELDNDLPSQFGVQSKSSHANYL